MTTDSTDEICSLVDVFAAPSKFKKQLKELQTAILKTTEELHAIKQRLKKAEEKEADLNAREAQIKYDETKVGVYKEQAARSREIGLINEREGAERLREAKELENRVVHRQKMLEKELDKLKDAKAALDKEKEVVATKSNRLDKTKARLVETLRE